MSEARVLSDRLEAILRDLNLSALESFREAKDDLLTIHELKLSRNLKRFSSTTYLLASEKRMRRPRGHAGIPALWVQLRTLTELYKQEQFIDAQESVA